MVQAAIEARQVAEAKVMETLRSWLHLSSN